MVDIMDYLYGPLSKDWCLYFYILSIFYFISFLFTIIGFIRYITSKNVDYNIAITSFMFSISVLVAYFVMRLLHGMCINSLK